MCSGAAVVVHDVPPHLVTPVSDVRSIPPDPTGSRFAGHRRPGPGSGLVRGGRLDRAPAARPAPAVLADHRGRAAPADDPERQRAAAPRRASAAGTHHVDDRSSCGAWSARRCRRSRSDDGDRLRVLEHLRGLRRAHGQASPARRRPPSPTGSSEYLSSTGCSADAPLRSGCTATPSSLRVHVDQRTGLRLDRDHAVDDEEVVRGGPAWRASWPAASTRPGSGAGRRRRARAPTSMPAARSCGCSCAAVTCIGRPIACEVLPVVGRDRRLQLAREVDDVDARVGVVVSDRGRATSGTEASASGM